MLKRKYGAIACGSAGAGRTVSAKRTNQAPGAYIWSQFEEPLPIDDDGFVDRAFATYAGDTTGSIVLVATVPQGTSVNARVGKKVLLKSLQIRGNVVSGSTTTTTTAAYMIIYDRRPTGTLPAITDVLNTVNSASFINDANADRFLVVHRADFGLVGPNSGSTSTWTEATYRVVNKTVRLRNLPCVFKAAGTGVIGDISEGALYLVTVGDQAAGTAAALVRLGLRTHYSDC